MSSLDGQRLIVSPPELLRAVLKRFALQLHGEGLTLLNNTVPLFSHNCGEYCLRGDETKAVSAGDGRNRSDLAKCHITRVLETQTFVAIVSLLRPLCTARVLFSLRNKRGKGQRGRQWVDRAGNGS